MKSIIVVAVLALAVATKASVIPLAPWLWGAPTLIQSNPAPSLIWTAPGTPPATIAIDTPTGLALAPGTIALAPGTITLVPSPAIAVAIEAGATSVSATRGAVHVAPLPGHAINQQQLNLAPAPGTI